MSKRLRTVAAAVLILATQGAALATIPPLAAPFGAGERLEYSVSFGHLHVGSGDMSLLRLDTLDGHPMWHAVLRISGGLPLFRVRDTTTSWFDTATFVSHRFEQHLHEGRYHADRTFLVDPVSRTYRKNDGPPTASSGDPLDDVSLVYFVRTLPLADGDRYELQRYFQPEGNPVVLRVIRRERITVPAGTFPAIVVQPEITTSGLFSHDGRAQLWFSDDSSRHLLQMKSGLSFGSINLYLTRITRGGTPE